MAWLHAEMDNQDKSPGLCFGALFVGITRLEYAGTKCLCTMYLNEMCQAIIQWLQVKLHCGMTKAIIMK